MTKKTLKIIDSTLKDIKALDTKTLNLKKDTHLKNQVV